MSTSKERQVALVTGAGQGVGRGIAHALAASGILVVVSDQDAQRALETAAAIESEGAPAYPLTLDVRSADDWARSVQFLDQNLGRLDILVNNAGISPRGSIESTSEALWERTLAVNLSGAFLGVKAAWSRLCHHRGTVVNVGSTRSTRPMRGMVAYGTSKAALLGLTRQVAVEGLKHGVTCNMIAPGWVDTPGERIIQAGLGRPEFPEGILNLTTIEEIGAGVVFLVSPAGRRINGVVLYMDAGLHLADDAGMVYLPETDTRRYT